MHAYTKSRYQSARRIIFSSVTLRCSLHGMLELARLQPKPKDQTAQQCRDSTHLHCFQVLFERTRCECSVRCRI